MKNVTKKMFIVFILTITILTTGLTVITVTSDISYASSFAMHYLEENRDIYDGDTITLKSGRIDKISLPYGCRSIETFSSDTSVIEASWAMSTVPGEGNWVTIKSINEGTSKLTVTLNHWDNTSETATISIIVDNTAMLDGTWWLPETETITMHPGEGVDRFSNYDLIEVTSSDTNVATVTNSTRHLNIVSRNPGTSIIIVKALDRNNNTVIATFTVNVVGSSKEHIKSANVTAISDRYYTGKPQTQNPVVKMGNNLLKNGVDYTLSYRNNTNVGKATIIITGLGIYTGKTELSFNIKRKKNTTVGRSTIRNTIANSAKKTNDVFWDSVNGATGYELSWKSRNSSKWAKRDVGNKVRGQISGMKSKGLYEIRVRAKKNATYTTNAAMGMYSPTVHRYFFTLQKIRLRSLGRGSFTMSWAKDSSATGYQLMYTTNANGSGAAKNIRTINNNSITNYTQKGLKPGRVYYVQVRPIKKVGSINYIGNISRPVPVRVQY